MKKKYIIEQKELLTQLEELQKDTDHEVAHHKADMLLLKYIGDELVTREYKAIKRLYA